MFKLFDLNKDGYLNFSEFATNMFKLDSSEFNIKIKLVFDLYDFDRDGFISKEDVVLLLSHTPMNKADEKITEIVQEGQFTQSGGGCDDYIDRAESQKELNNLVNICFADTPKMSFENFRNTLENVSSEMFLCIFSLLKTHFPTLMQYKYYEQGLRKKSDGLLASPSSGRRLALPKVLSRFSPLSSIVKFATPKLESRTIKIEKPNEEEIGEESKTGPPVVVRKATKQKSSFSKHVPDSPITPAVRLSLAKPQMASLTNSPIEPKGETKLFCECGKQISDFNKLLCSECILNLSSTKCEGKLMKFAKGKVKAFWVCVEKKELFSTIFVS